jgi:hypothetical protein
LADGKCENLKPGRKIVASLATRNNFDRDLGAKTKQTGFFTEPAGLDRIFSSKTRLLGSSCIIPITHIPQMRQANFLSVVKNVSSKI